ncbi:B-box zinc finger protein 24-like [Rhododendron vialii]|uniref:B-box zinc finger protein 24-like n=1 Tax=Rhododendron vialii TaxID=182163 RepID=UPI00265F1520|nr:B-box zinc finger protein 24-like [Rhododendron vialii]
MKIQCDVCEKAPATLICCADEAALCAKCDVDIHAANKLASKHQRLLLQSLSTKLPRCDICQEKAAFIFCVEDRALFCQDCDEPIHSAGSLSANHQRFLATGIRVALGSNCTKEIEKSHQDPKPPKHNAQPVAMKMPTAQQASSFGSPSWAVDDLLQFSDFESSDKSMQKEQVGFGELDWFADIGLFGEQVPHKALAPAEVPQLPAPQSSNYASYRPPKSNMPYKKPRIEISNDDTDDYFTVPDLG